MTGIITNENSFYIRTALDAATPTVILDLFETPSRWLTADWLGAEHASGERHTDQTLRCLWRDGVSRVNFDLIETRPGTFRLDVSLTEERAMSPDRKGADLREHRDIGAIANACSIARQRFLTELSKGRV